MTIEVIAEVMEPVGLVETHIEAAVFVDSRVTELLKDPLMLGTWSEALDAFNWTTTTLDVVAVPAWDT